MAPIKASKKERNVPISQTFWHPCILHRIHSFPPKLFFSNVCYFVFTHHTKLESFVLILIRPIRMKLPHIILHDNFIIFFVNLLTIVIMINTLSAIAFNNIRTQKADGFVCYLAFSRALFCGKEESYWVLCSSTLLQSETIGYEYLYKLLVDRRVFPIELLSSFITETEWRVSIQRCWLILYLPLIHARCVDRLGAKPPMSWVYRTLMSWWMSRSSLLSGLMSSKHCQVVDCCSFSTNY